MRWVIVLACLIMLLAHPLVAAAQVYIDITAIGRDPEGQPGIPSELTASYISNNWVKLTWVKGAYADETIVVRQVGRPPESIDDGEVIYRGEREVIDDWHDISFVDAWIYYRAWSYNEYGYSLSFAETRVRGGGYGMANAIALIPLILLLGGLTVLGDMRRNWLLILVAGLGWFLFAGWCMSVSERMYDIWFVFAIVAVMLAIVTFVWPLVTRPREMPSEKESELDERERAWGGRRPRHRSDDNE